MSCALCAHRPDHSIRITTRELSQKTGLVPSSLNRAIKQLCDKKPGWVTLRPGSTIQASAYLCNFLATVRSASFGEALSKKAPPQTVLSFEQESASLREALPTVNKALASAEAALDGFRLENPILDRVLRSKVQDHDPETIAYFRRFLHGYMRKLDRDDQNRRHADTGAEPHPPDNEIVAAPPRHRRARPPRPHAGKPNLRRQRHPGQRTTTPQLRLVCIRCTLPPGRQPLHPDQEGRAATPPTQARPAAGGAAQQSGYTSSEQLWRLKDADLQELREAVEAEQQPSARARSQAKRERAAEDRDQLNSKKELPTP